MRQGGMRGSGAIAADAEAAHSSCISIIKAPLRPTRHILAESPPLASIRLRMNDVMPTTRHWFRHSADRTPLK